MNLSNKVYDVIKQIALVWIPAIETLYSALCGIWGLPLGIVGTLAAVDAFLGAVLKISSINYNKQQKGNDNHGDNTK